MLTKTTTRRLLAPIAAAAVAATALVSTVPAVAHDRGRHLGWYKQQYRSSYYDAPRYDTQRYNAYAYDGPVWQGRDGRYYCRRENGTTGLLIGAAVGGLVGHEVAGRRGDRTLGVVLGAAGGALLGRAIDKSSGARCR